MVRNTKIGSNFILSGLLSKGAAILSKNTLGPLGVDYVDKKLENHIN
jgi:hypothetical protein